MDAAMLDATEDMVRWLAEREGLALRDALALASVAVSLRVTQVVNGVRGVHALIVARRSFSSCSVSLCISSLRRC